MGRGPLAPEPPSKAGHEGSAGREGNNVAPSERPSVRKLQGSSANHDVVLTLTPDQVCQGTVHPQRRPTPQSLIRPRSNTEGGQWNKRSAERLNHPRNYRSWRLWLSNDLGAVRPVPSLLQTSPRGVSPESYALGMPSTAASQPIRKLAQYDWRNSVDLTTADGVGGHSA